MQIHITTLVLMKDGRMHLVLKDCSLDDAVRWVEAGYIVFRVVANHMQQWAVNHVNSGKVFISEGGGVAVNDEIVKMLTNKEKPT